MALLFWKSPSLVPGLLNLPAMLTDRLGLCAKPFKGEEKARFCPGELCLMLGLGRLNTGSLLGTSGTGLEGDCVALNS